LPDLISPDQLVCADFLIVIVISFVNFFDNRERLSGFCAENYELTI